MTRSQSPRWWPAALLLVLAAVMTIGLRIHHADDISNQVIVTWIVGLATSLLLLLWWLFLSRLPWSLRLKGVAAILVAAGAFAALFRFDGMGGDFVPQFSFRFASQAPTFEGAGNAGEAGLIVESGNSAQEPAAIESPWPEFRGPLRDGRAPQEVVRGDWQDSAPAELWRRPVGPAWSSFVIANDLLITQEQRGDQEVVSAYHLDSGEPVWVHSDTARHETFLGGVGPRATPTLSGPYIYSLGATGLLNCLKPETGELVWQRDIAKDSGTQQLDFGFAGSPLVVDDLVVVNPGLNLRQDQDPGFYDQAEPAAVIAYHRETGEVMWKNGKRQAGYGAPRLETIDGVRQILIYMGWGLASIDPADGSELWWWEFRNPYGTNSVQPIVTSSGDVFLTTEATGSALLDPRLEGEQWVVDVRWQRPNQFKLRFNGGVLKGDHVYGLDGGILAAFDLNEGRRAWKKGRYRFGQILLLRDYLLVLAESGDVALVEISPAGMNEVAKFEAIEGRCWNHPVVYDGKLYVRSDQEMAAFDLNP